jgi:hypothetical protein
MKGRFCADILSMALAKTLFNSSWIGLAQARYTATFFSPLPASVIGYLGAVLHHCITEYKSGQFSLAKCEGQDLISTLISLNSNTNALL